MRSTLSTMALAQVRELPAWSGPVGLGVGGIAVTGLVAVVDPNGSGIFPSCPSWTYLGVLCPFCGGLRGVHALTQGDLGGMMSSNLLLPIVLVGATWWWAAWLLRTTGHDTIPPPTLSRRTWIIAAVAVAIYSVLRNLTGTPFEILAP